MIFRPIPKTNELIPVVGLGTYKNFDVATHTKSREPLKEVLKIIHQHNNAVIDSSPMYGSSDSVVGDLVSELGLRKLLFFATKVWIQGKAQGIARMEQSFQRIKNEIMDLMQIHNLVDWQTHTQTLQAWKEKGRVRYLGITHYQKDACAQLETVLKTKQFDFIQLNYSLIEQEAEERLLPLAQELAVAVIVNRPFAQSALFSKVRGQSLPAWASAVGIDSWAQFFLQFIVSHPAVTCMIPATQHPHHLQDNWDAFQHPNIEPHTRQQMIDWLASI
ncbi:MAG: aldo/keto reductase [Limnohabitans sp.]|nr:aldo/keto reductase [Limnohabitans sp.]